MVALGLDDTLDLLLHATDGCGHATSRQRLRCFLQAFDEVSLVSLHSDILSTSLSTVRCQME